MKLYIWKEVLWDYTPGMAVGYGKDLETVLEKFEPHIARQLGPPTKVIDVRKDKEIYVDYVYGGG